MTITDIDSFLNYYSRVRERTDQVIGVIPPDNLEWSYAKDKFTLGDLVRHIAAIERYMYAETIQDRPAIYRGCGTELAEGYDQVMDFYHRLHRESLEIFMTLTPEKLNSKCQTSAGFPITIWKWLRAMVEHEIHHRGQIYIYLGMLGVKTPPIYGLTSEELIEKSGA